MNTRRTCMLMGLLLVWLLPASPLSARSDFSLTWYLMRDDNAFQNRSLHDEWINSYSFYAGRTFTSDMNSIRVYYKGDLSTFSHYSDRQNHSQRIGVAASRLLRDGIIGNIGANTRMRRNKAQYIYYNIDTYKFYANIRIEPGLTDILTGGVSLNRNNYKEFSEINNAEYLVFGRYQHFFQNRFSVSTEIGVGSKNYFNQTKSEFFGFQLGQRQLPRVSEEAIIATLFTGSLNVGKSLSNRTGVNLEVGGRWYIGDPIEAFTDDIYYYTENDLFDDPYSYEGNFAALHATRQFAIGFQGKAGVSYEQKNYRGTPALTIDGNLTGDFREDNRTEYYLLLTKTFKTGFKFPKNIDGFFRFLARKNASNDPYYDYTDHIGIIGITISK